MSIPRITHPTERPNFTRLDMGGLTIFFSYQTPIAFINSQGITARKNQWGPTTGKHLNFVSTKQDLRLSGEEFEKRLQEAMS